MIHEEAVEAVSAIGPDVIALVVYTTTSLPTTTAVTSGTSLVTVVVAGTFTPPLPGAGTIVVLSSVVVLPFPRLRWI